MLLKAFGFQFLKGLSELREHSEVLKLCNILQPTVFPFRIIPIKHARVMSGEINILENGNQNK